MSISKLFEYSAEQLKQMKSYGAQIKDMRQVKDYEIFLYFDPHIEDFTNGKYKYQVGFQRGELEFTNPNHYMNKHVFTDDGIDISAFREIEKILHEWTNKYRSIGIGSHDDRKLRIYKRIFEKLDFRVDTINVFDKEMIFIS